MSNEAKTRESWNTRMGFLFAAIGSAVGLGNIWRFPYLTAESGGASFVILYLILLFVIGIPVMLSEFVIGRSTRKSPVQALSQPGNVDWGALGVLFVVTGFGILSYYSVVAGWMIRYIVDALFGDLLTVPLIDDLFVELLAVPPDDYFSMISKGHAALFFHFLFMVITAIIVVGGVEEGIERTVKILLPLLVLLIVGLAVWAFIQPGSIAGYRFYLNPGFNELFSFYGVFGLTLPFLNLTILADAAGQTFFTLSLGMGAMITYASYLSRKEDLIEETLIVSFSNFTISFLAGLTIFPIIASFGLMGEVQESTIATLFIAIPKAFQQIGGVGGSLLSIMFFGSLLLAALTSSISLLEVVTSSLIDELNLARTPAGLISGATIFLVGVPSAYNIDFLGLADQIAGNLLLMAGGFFLAIYSGWFMREAALELRKGLSLPSVSLWRILNRFVVPPVLFTLLIAGVSDLIKTFALQKFSTQWGLLGYGWLEYLSLLILLLILVYLLGFRQSRFYRD